MKPLTATTSLSGHKKLNVKPSKATASLNGQNLVYEILKGILWKPKPLLTTTSLKLSFVYDNFKSDHTP